MNRIAIAVFGLASLVLIGCKDSGVYAAVGDINAPIEVSDAEDNLTARLLFSMSGAKVWSRKDSSVRMSYTNQYTNTYVGCITKQGVQVFGVEVDPCVDEAETNADHSAQ